MDNRELARALLEAVGADNVTDAVHCMTRLRITVRAVTATKEQLQRLPGVKGVLFPAAGQIHVVLGPGKAAAVTAAFNELRHGAGAAAPADSPEAPSVSPSASPSVAQLAQGAAPGDGKALHEAIRARNRRSVWKQALQHIGHIFLPLIPAFIGCGLLAGLLSLFLRAVPGLADIRLFGEALIPGRGGVFAALAIGVASATVERFLRRHVPESLDLFLTPLGTLFAVALGALFVFQPLGGWLSDALRVFALTALERGGAGTGFVLGGVFLPVVMAGVHHGITPINLDLLATTGTTLLLPICAMAGAGQVGAALAVYLKTRNQPLKKTILSALPVGILGIGEPLIYGVTLPLGRPFLAACFGGACGGAWQAFAATGAYAIGISGLPLAASVTRPGAYLAGVTIAYVTGFAAACLLGFDDPPAEETP